MIESTGAYIPIENVTEGNAHDSVRERVRKLRMKELDCVTIAKLTDLTLETVQEYCRELGLPVSGTVHMPASSKQNKAVCLQCGEPLTQTTRGRWKKFCSARCKAAWWREHPEEQKKKPRMVECENCGQIFPAYNDYKHDRKYCCRACYLQARYGIKGYVDEEDEGQ